MKILFIQIGDMHVYDREQFSNSLLQRFSEALVSIGQIDAVCLLICGDLSKSGSRNDFLAVNRVVGSLLSTIGRVFKKRVNCYITPGNHDLDLKGDKRNYQDILPLLKEKRDNNYYTECNKLEAFFDFAALKYCFMNQQKDVHRKYLIIGNHKVQINLLNTAPFSSTMADDKRAHHIPLDALQKITRQDGVDLNITIMHHSTEWFCEDTKRKLEDILFENCELVFQGHEHYQINNQIETQLHQNLCVIRNGEFSISSTKTEFNTIVFDFDTYLIDYTTFTWDVENNLFTSNVFLQPIRKKSTSLTPSQVFMTDFLKDDHNLNNADNFIDYYTFPALIPKDRESETRAAIKTPQDFFEILEKVKYVCVQGENQSGKTSLLKYLYNYAVEQGYLPLIIENTPRVDTRIDRIIKRLFEDQYSEQSVDWEKFRQTDNSKKIILVDDIDLLKHDNTRETLIEHLSKNFALVIMSADIRISADLLELAKEDVRKSEYLFLNLLPMYRSKRTELIFKVCKLRGLSEERIEEIANNIDKLVTQVGGLFSLSPEFILKFLSFYLQGERTSPQKDSIFGAIFESDITRAISESTKKGNVDIFRPVLEELAYYIHFNKKVALSSDEIKSLITDYNAKYEEHVAAEDFIKDMLNAKIFIQADDLNYRFKDKNVLAYFVARCLSRNIDRKRSYPTDLDQILHDVCFGINGTIVLFLSYLRSSIDLIRYFIFQVESLFAETPELDVDGDNELFFRIPSNMEVNAPKTSDRESLNDNFEEVEQQTQTLANVQYKDIYDYRSEDAELPHYKIERAMKYIDLIAKSLISIRGVIEAEDKRIIIDKIYTLPNRVLYAVFEPAYKHFDEIVKELTEFMQEYSKNPKILESEAISLLQHSAWSVILGVYDNIAFNCVDVNSIIPLDNYNLSSTQHRIQNLIMHEQLGNTTDFINKAIALFESKKDILQQYLVRRVVKVHVMKHPSIKNNALNRLNSKIFDEQKKVNLLTSRGKINHD